MFCLMFSPAPVTPSLNEASNCPADGEHHILQGIFGLLLINVGSAGVQAGAGALNLNFGRAPRPVLHCELGVNPRSRVTRHKA